MHLKPLVCLTSSTKYLAGRKLDNESGELMFLDGAIKETPFTLSIPEH